MHAPLWKVAAKACVRFSLSAGPMEGMGPGGTLKVGFSMSITMSPPNLQPYCSVTFIVNVLGPVPLFLLPPGLCSMRS